MLKNEVPNGTQDQKPQAPETPVKSFSEKLFETLGSSVPQEGGETPATEVAEAPKVEDKPDPRLELYKEKVKGIVDEYEADIKRKKELLPNTKDEKVKFQMEKDIFEMEKKISILKADLSDEPSVADLTEVEALFAGNEIKKDGESWKLVQEMAKFSKGGPELVKLFTKVASAVVKDMKAQAQPLDINKDIPKDKPSEEVKPSGPPGLVDQAIANFKKNYS